ncbi:MAG TPA: dihydropteroate synthase [Solirubrobacteraceae bacterium]|nr:dihydropteroate synthase [Solirubrobacteraceae bacterium]
MKLRLRDRELTTAADEPLIMGILNIGLDSVADGRVFASVEEQVQRGLQLVADGAQIIDVGVLSGRTDTDPIPVAEEAARFEPVVRALAREGVTVSVDAWRAGAIEAALAAGAHLINDTSGLLDPAVAEMAAATGAGLVVMHTRAAPKQVHFPNYDDPVADVLAFLGERIELAREHGVADEQIVIDPGLDYAKAPQESVQILRRLPELEVFARPLLLAVSRKYFIGMLTDTLPEDRLAGTIAALEFGVSHGARIVRVHDVAQVAQYLRLRAALHGDGPVAMRGSRDDERLKWIAPKAP